MSGVSGSGIIVSLVWTEASRHGTLFGRPNIKPMRVVSAVLQQMVPRWSSIARRLLYSLFHTPQDRATQLYGICDDVLCELKITSGGCLGVGRPGVCREGDRQA